MAIDGTNPLYKLKESLRKQAFLEGFDVVAFAPALPPPHGEQFSAWLAQNQHGDMNWLTKHPERRMDPRLLLDGLGVVLVLGVNYCPKGDPLYYLQDPGAMGVAAYSRNLDYHDLLKKRLKALGRWLATQLGQQVDGRIFVDTAPVLEKPLGAAAGLGWQGKNTMLISRTFGCWLFLGELFLALPLPPDPVGRNHCGSCRHCLDACPTDALSTPWRLDASRCLSYMTIELAGPIPKHYRQAMGNRVFGCDDCLAVCPWNRFAQNTQEPDFLPSPALKSPRLLDFVSLDDAEFRQLFRKSPIKRAGRIRLMRNLAVALGNWGHRDALPALIKLFSDENPLIRGHAAWGLGQLWQRWQNAETGTKAVAALLSGASREQDAYVMEEISAVWTMAPTPSGGENTFNPFSLAGKNHE